MSAETKPEALDINSLIKMNRREGFSTSFWGTIRVDPKSVIVTKDAGENALQVLHSIMTRRIAKGDPR